MKYFMRGLVALGMLVLAGAAGYAAFLCRDSNNESGIGFGLLTLVLLCGAGSLVMHDR